MRYSVFIASFIACSVALINKYPLIYSDTGSYIYSGFNGLVFDDRSIFYGLFLRHISLATSLWFVIFAQSLIICYLIFLTIGIFFNGIKKEIIFIFLITFLTLTTSFSYTVSILIPDIFSSITILSFINLIFNNSLKRKEKTFISILFIFSISTQFSSVVIMLLIMIVSYLFFAFRKMCSKPVSFDIRRLSYPFVLVISCLIIIPSAHFAFNKEFKISGSTHVFVMNHLLETGVLEDYLAKNCDDKKYRICNYKDRLGWNFIWEENGVIQKTGGWKANKKEYNEIIQDIITTPKYISLLSIKAFEYSMKQFFSFNITISPPQLNNSPPLAQINWRFSDNYREYISSLQNSSKWNLDLQNFVQYYVIIISLVFLLLVIFIRSFFHKLSIELRGLIVLVLLHNVLNSIICSNLSTIDSRFQSRLIWLLPFCAFLIIFKYLDQRKFFTKIPEKE
jgi:hypothetical protein